MKIIICSVKEAAQKLGISDSHCRRLLETKKIKGFKLGHDWVVRDLKYKRKRKPKECGLGGMTKQDKGKF